MSGDAIDRELRNILSKANHGRPVIVREDDGSQWVELETALDALRICDQSVPRKMPKAWTTVRDVVRLAKPDWKPINSSAPTPDDAANVFAYEFTQKVIEAYSAHLQARCSGCGERKDPYDFYRCWDCNAYLCQSCIRSHGVTNIPHPKLVQQYELEISGLKAVIAKYIAHAESDVDQL